MADTPRMNDLPTLVEGVAKLIQFTQEGRIKWYALHPESVPLDGQEYERIEAAYETNFSGRKLRLYKRSFKSIQRRLSTTMLLPQNEFYPIHVEEIVLENLDDRGNVVFTFPSLESLSNLLSAVQYQAGGKELLEAILAFA